MKLLFHNKHLKEEQISSNQNPNHKAIWFLQMKLLRDVWFSLLREVAVDTKLRGLITGEPFFSAQPESK
jgi:hypothetical protein